MKSNVLQFPNAKNSRAEDRREAINADARKVARKMVRNVKIPRAERRVIATRLNDEIERPGVTHGDLCSRPEADLSYGPKQLDKMLWRQGNKEDKELLAFSAPYLKVIQALAKCTKQDYLVLLDRILVGTSLHRLNAAGGALDEVEKTLRGLQAVASQVSESLGLFHQFQETQRLKREGFARGELNNWPNYDLEEDDLPEVEGDQAPAIFPHDGEGAWQEQVQEMGALWPVEGGPELKNLGYLPHVYLGILETWIGWGLPKDPRARAAWHRDLAREYTRVPTAIYAEGRLPEVINTGEAACGPPLTVDDFLHAWLILYPDATMSGIVPVLLTLDPTVGTVLERVDSRTLIELQQVVLVERHPSAYDGVVELLAPPSGSKSLVDHWTETGRWFGHNPILSAEARRAEARARRDRLFNLEVTDAQR